MAFSAKDVAHLREMTGVGMMDCKKALTESNGDFDKAVEFLREKGLAAATKKAGRIAAEGIVDAYVCDEYGAALLEVNSETDFVAKNESFRTFVADLNKIILTEKPTDVEALLNLNYLDSGLTVASMLQEKILTIGENIKIRRFERVEAGAGIVNVVYIHMGGKIGVLVTLKVSEGLESNATVAELGKDIAMQIAAMNPQWLNKESVPADVIDKEKAILLAQTIEEGKPEKVAEKIVMGRIGKFFSENCLVEQAFVKENKISVKQQIANIAKEVGGSIEVVKYFRYEKGEGLAKREDNFADEVASMIK
ncbi:MAG: elongation factor Ts [Clostridiales bacterium]|nr:elongation factor Ts [Clostridiales bacterium]